MISPLSFFYQVYQCREDSQTVNLKVEKERFVFPKNHPDAKSIYEALPDIDLIDEQKSRISYIEGQGQFFHINGTGWLLRHSKFMTKSPRVQDAPRGPGSSHILRPVMNQRLRNTIQEHELGLITPDEYLVELPTSKNQTTDPSNYYKRFAVISKKLEILDYQDTLQRLKGFSSHQLEKVADDICKLIFYSGWMDAHFANIMVTTEDKVAVVDTEGHGFLHEIGENYTPIPLVDARIYGLKELILWANRDGLPIIERKAKEYLFWAQVRKVVKIALIIFSILCPLIPLIILCCSAAYAAWHNSQRQRKVANSLASFNSA